MSISVRQVCLCALFTALIAAGAFLRVPVSPVSTITLQLLFVLMAAVMLGARWSVMAVAAYILLGLAGAPMFAGGGGLSYAAQPTFGFVYGFIPAALIAGRVSALIKRVPGGAGRGRAIWGSIAGCAAALPALYLCGVAHGALVLTFVLGKELDLWSIVWGWCLVYLPFDLIKAAAAGYVGALVARRLPGRTEAAGQRAYDGERQ